MTRVLLADDHPIMLTGIQGILRESGYEVVAAVTTGSLVLDNLAATDPEICVFDVRMPELSGLDLLRLLRSRGDERPVVLLTANLEDGELVEAINLGVAGILLKESAQTLLVRCLDEVRGGGRWIDRLLLERALAITARSGKVGSSSAAALTAREAAVAELVSRGLRNREVAKELGLSEGTVKVYLYRIYEKLGINNRTELAIRIASVRRAPSF